jgi:hypothetical protein
VVELRLPADARLSADHLAVVEFAPSDGAPPYVREARVEAGAPAPCVRLASLPAGPVRLHVHLPGVASGGPCDTVVPAGSEGRAGPVTLERLATLAVSLAPPPTPQAPVYLVVEGEEIGGASLRRREVIAPAPEVVLPHLPPGRYAVTARAAGCAITTLGAIGLAPDTRTAVVLELPPEARVTLVLLDARGEPPATCYLRLQLPNGRTLDRLPDASPERALRPIAVVGGRAELRELPSGRIAIEASVQPTGPFATLGAMSLEPGDQGTLTFTWRG